MALNRSTGHPNRQFQSVRLRIDRRKSLLDVMEHVAAGATATMRTAADTGDRTQAETPPAPPDS